VLSKIERAPLAEGLKTQLKRLLLSKNILISRPTETALLAQLLASLRPVRTNHDLIRIGGQRDGGYLVPNDLEQIGACFSPGVDKVADFELDLANRGIHCFLADHSVDVPPIHHDLFDFEKKYLGSTEDSVHTTLDSWVARKAPGQTDFILQMDIEGAEYGVILDTSSETLRKFRILVIEFHELDAIRDKFGFRLANLTFHKILKDFEVVHIHPNNYRKPIVYKDYQIPPALEFTFLRKDRITMRRRTFDFPHALDRTNCAHKEDFSLPKCWFQ
jgi:hypothetical protein